MGKKAKLTKAERRWLTEHPAVAAIILICVLLVTAWQSGIFTPKKDIAVSGTADGVLYVQYIDIGQGDAALITTPTGEVALIDAGPRASAKALIDTLETTGITTIDYFILTHPHEDHIGGAPDVFAKFEVKRVLMPDATANTSIFRKTLEAIEDESADAIIAEPEATYPLGDAVMNILAPFEFDSDDANNASIVIKLSYGDTAFLFTGDAEVKSEQQIMNHFSTNALKVDMLKVGHHGSSTSTGEEFLRAVNPTYAIISCQTANEYGHPHAQTLELLEKYKINVLRTDKLGTIILSSDGETVTQITSK